MVPLDRDMLSIVIMSPSAAVWPQFLMKGLKAINAVSRNR